MKKIIFAILTLTICIFSAFAQTESGSKHYPGLTWSPDGKKIAFVSGKFPSTNIFANADGSNEVKMTQ